jgi:hypothetical protein
MTNSRLGAKGYYRAAAEYHFILVNISNALSEVVNMSSSLSSRAVIALVTSLKLLAVKKPPGLVPVDSGLGPVIEYGFALQKITTHAMTRPRRPWRQN